MRFYLRSQGLWNVVVTDSDPPPLIANPTIAQMKAHEEEKLKKDKAIICLHSGLADHIFTKIMNLETPKQVWDKLQIEFESSKRVKAVKLLAFKKEFELMKMKDNESVKDYSGRLMDVVNQMRLLGNTFEDHKEQRVHMRDDEAVEGAFQANNKGRSADSGCTSHMSKFLSIFSSIDRSVQSKIKLGNGDIVQAKGKGTVAVSTNKGIKTITNVLYIPELDQNLLNVAQMLKNGYEVSFKEKFCFITNTHNSKIAKIKMDGNSFYLKLDDIKGHVFSANIDESILWHKRFGHYNLNSLKLLYDTGMVENMSEIHVTAHTCGSCELGKQHRQPFPKGISKRATHKLELVHLDIYGPMSTASLSNNMYFILFIDDFSRMTWVYFLKTKSQALFMFKNFKSITETQSGQKIKVLRTDNEGEYILKEFNTFCLEAGIVHQLTVPYSLQQNGVFERKNRTMMEMSRYTVILKVRPLSDVYERCNLVHVERTNYTEAAGVPAWIEAMKSEIDSIERNGTWRLTELHKDKKEIGLKWVFRTKFNPDGSIFKHKARLVVKGFAQVAGVDYGDTFAPQPEGFVVTGNEHKVYKLHKLVISLYVDNKLVTGSNAKFLEEFKTEIQDVFEMSNLGIMNYFLGMKIHQCSSGIFVSQRKYVVDILKKFKLESCKEVATLLTQNEKISKNDGEKLEDPYGFKSLVGSLL
ncbi:hypothetical protein D5086_003529 [Populus alba]|uniref:Uncharacterized protein n=1 Tax=Populus alba TaxID=43335 RepID=A0ACC4D579_POPAL